MLASARFPLAVFAVEDRAVQLTWRSLPVAEAVVEVGDARAELAGPGPGACSMEGLEPQAAYDVTVAGPGVPRRRVASVRTLPAAPGRELTRFATISDLHIGESRFGALGTIADRPGREPFTLRCARTALEEAAAWGARLVVVKGDLTHDSAPAEFRVAGRLLAASPVPVFVGLGNHDVRHRVDGPSLLEEAGLDVTATVCARDLPGVRIVLAHTALSRHRWGELDGRRRAQVTALAAEAEAGAFVAVHHQPDTRAVPLSYPPGIVRSDANPFLDELAAAHPATVVSAGHTHRHRRRRHGPVVVTEVGSTKDYPGVWAGYAVHEGGIRQVVRRIGDPQVLEWTDATARALGGLWGPWAAGRRADRCFTHPWPR